MTGRDEELALERIRITELEQEHLRAWMGKRFLDAKQIEGELVDARAHVERLEREG